MDWGPNIRRKSPVVLCFDEKDMAIQVSVDVPQLKALYPSYMRTPKHFHLYVTTVSAFAKETIMHMLALWDFIRITERQS